jgi:hypothetical protein
MKTFVFTSSAIEGEIEFRYNEDGTLIYFENRAILDKHQHGYLIRHFPFTIPELVRLSRNGKQSKLTEVEIEITFDMFWTRYDHKAVSSKKKSEAIWKRLSKADKQKAYHYIYRYFQSLPAGVAKKYTETYLNSSIWNN